MHILCVVKFKQNYLPTLLHMSTSKHTLPCLRLVRLIQFDIHKVDVRLSLASYLKFSLCYIWLLIIYESICCHEDELLLLCAFLSCSIKQKNTTECGKVI